MTSPQTTPPTPARQHGQPEAGASPQSSPGAAPLRTRPELSPQRRRQLRLKQQGRCPTCGSEGCKVCIEKQRTAARNRYRIAHDIPLDKPIARTGRPRKPVPRPNFIQKSQPALQP